MASDVRKRKSPRRRAKWAVITIALGFIAASCGSSSTNSTATTKAAGGTATTAAAGGTATTAAAGGTATTAAPGKAPSGDPIVVMNEAPIDTNVTPYPNIPAAAEVYAEVHQRQGRHQRSAAAGHHLRRQGRRQRGGQLRPQGRRGEGRRQRRLVHDRRQPRHPDLEENKIAWFGACCPIVSPGEHVEDLVPDGLRQRVRHGRRHQDDRGRLQVRRRRRTATSRSRDVFHTGFNNGYKSRGGDPTELEGGEDRRWLPVTTAPRSPRWQAERRLPLRQHRRGQLAGADHRRSTASVPAHASTACRATSTARSPSSSRSRPTAAS